jgi:hypothetical protein
VTLTPALDRLALARSYLREERGREQRVSAYEGRRPHMDAEGGYRRPVRKGDMVRAIDFRSPYHRQVGRVVHVGPGGKSITAHFGPKPDDTEGTGIQWFRRVPSEEEKLHYSNAMNDFDVQHAEHREAQGLG